MDCVIARWTPGIGDPSLMGWATVALYFAAAAAAWLARPSSATPVQRWFWTGLSAALIILGVNKELDLQTLFTSVGRCLALAEGWYGERRQVQAAFVAALAVAGAGGVGWALWRLRRAPPGLRIALVGAGLLVIFVLMRASSFHHMDIFINTRLAGLRMNWIVEIGALGVIIAGAWRARADREQN